MIQKIKYAYHTRILFFESYVRIFTYDNISYAYPRTLKALLYQMGVHVVQGKGAVLGVFVLYFHNGKCH